jgi:hypothetical protein
MNYTEPFAVSSDQTWLTFSVDTLLGNGFLNISATANSGVSRTAKLTISASGIPNRTIIVSQESLLEIPVTGISLDSTLMTLLVGATDTLNATLLPINATIKDVVWKSDNASVVSVCTSGIITTNTPGIATITCTLVSDTSISASIIIKVNQFSISSQQVKLASDSGSTNTVYVSSNEPWSVSYEKQNESWLTINPSTTNIYNGAITFTASKNTNTIAREATVTVSSIESTTSASIYVTQATGDTIMYINSPKRGSFLNIDSTVSFTVKVKDTSVAIDSVVFYVESTKMFVDKTAPYSFDWKVSGSESIDIQAKAYFNGDSTIDAPWYYINAAPVITLIPEQIAGTNKLFTNVDLTTYIKDVFTSFAKLKISIDKNDYVDFTISNGSLIATQTDKSWTGTILGYITVTDEQGLSTTDSILYTQPYLLETPLKAPTGSFYTNTSFIKVGDSVQFSTSLQSTDTVIWNFSGGKQISGTDLRPYVQFDSIGVYSISMLLKNNIDQFVMEKKNYIIVSALNITDTVICKGDTVSISVLGNGFNSFSWNTDPVQTTQSIQVMPSKTTTYKVTMKKGLAVILDSAIIVIAKQPELGNDTSFCEGSTLTLNPGKFSKYYWNNITTEGDAIFNATTSGKIKVKTIDALGCVAYDSVTIGSLYPKPIINLGNDTTFCWKKSKTLDAGNVGSKYIWSTGATSQLVLADTTKSYSVTVTNNKLCSNAKSININVKIPIVPQIGVVTLSSTNKNLIAWEPINNKGIAKYHVWKQNNVNTFDIVKTINMGDTSVYIDGNSNPISSSNCYALSTNDSVCNNESYLSSTHCSIHLSCILQNDGTVKATWNNYEGITVTSYSILRAEKGKTLLPYATQIADTGLNTVYIDHNAIGLNSNYQVSFSLESPITLNSLKSDSGPFSQSLSNMAESELTNVVITNNDAVIISPNPTNSFTTISVTSQQAFYIDVIDILGRVIATKSGIGALKLDCSNFKVGVYFIKVQTKNTLITRSLVVE